MTAASTEYRKKTWADVWDILSTWIHVLKFTLMEFIYCHVVVCSVTEKDFMAGC